ncbi:iron-sulfur cluster assembly scaffold protein [Amylibacter sp. IMCC11727]|uniref:iron-sulfur cluster assembly scaffold protein n=1 Tax=Amylibacter sp. IMCC11727 TaxID=3039851 RepID=UPI00244E1ECE|nr:iron-sulfur cluster assembly scaffold protein [Amylibacter sp. IMCC11727]WGI20436.1 iron-sulfur cluster assembly scaffold protein [Amylibacter sp. IMCC11727]
MADASDMIKLYSNQILALAAHIPHSERLDTPDRSEMKRSPLCGSTVTVDVAVKDGVVSDFGQDVKACALGQAAASVLGASVIGQSLESIRTGRDQLAAMLKSDGPAPDAPFDRLKVLEPAKAYKNRHASILLAFDATVAALDSLDETA